jgi:hypothetical protein
MLSAALGNIPGVPGGVAPAAMEFVHAAWYGNSPQAEGLMLCAKSGLVVFYQLTDPLALRNAGIAGDLVQHPSADSDEPVLTYQGKWTLGARVLQSLLSSDGCHGIVADDHGAISYLRKPGLGAVGDSRSGFELQMPTAVTRSAMKAPVRLLAGHTASIRSLAACTLLKGPLASAALALHSTHQAEKSCPSETPVLLFSGGGQDASTRCWNLTPRFVCTMVPGSDGESFSWKTSGEQLLSLQASSTQLPVAVSVFQPEDRKRIRGGTAGSCPHALLDLQRDLRLVAFACFYWNP